MREVTGWICRHPDDLTDTQRRNLTVVRTACPGLDALVGHVRAFAAMLTQLAGQKHNDWIHASKPTGNRNCTRSSAGCRPTTTPSAPA